MAQCRACGRASEAEFRYCPWRATPQRRKLVEFFTGADQDSRKAIRGSRYLPERRVRFSIWDESGTGAAVSLEEEEAARLGAFVTPPPARKSRLLHDLRAFMRR